MTDQVIDETGGPATETNRPAGGTKRPVGGTKRPVGGTKRPVGEMRICIYAQILPLIRDAAFACGYAIGLHGSVVRDLDLIAAPWTEDAKPAEELVEAVRLACDGFVPDVAIPMGRSHWVPTAQRCEVKPHGRRTWNICWGGHAFIDLSVMPRGEDLPCA